MAADTEENEMALGTNYRRNLGREDSAASKRMAKAQALAKELGDNLGLAAAVILGRMTLDEAKQQRALAEKRAG